MELVKRVASSGALLTILDQGVVSLGNFLAIAIPAKNLSDHQFGVYVVTLTAILLCTGFTKAIVTNPFRVLGVEFKGKALDAFLTQQVVYLMLLSWLTAIFIGFVVSKFFIATVAQAIAAGGAFISFQLHDFSRAVRSVEFQWGILLFSDTIIHTIRIGGLLCLWYYHEMNCENALLMYALSSLASPLLTGFFRRIYPFSSSQFFITIKKTWQYGRWLFAETIAYSISTQAYIFFIGLSLNTTMAGIYGSLQQLINVINILHIGISGYLTPSLRKKLIKGDFSGWRNQLYLATFVLLILTVILVTLICVFGKEIITFIYNPSWAEYVSVLYFLSGAAILGGVNVVLSLAFRTANLPQVGFIAKTLSALATVTLTWPLLRNWGIHGAAVGLILTQTCWMLVYLYELTVRSRLSGDKVRFYLQ